MQFLRSKYAVSYSFPVCFEKFVYTDSVIIEYVSLVEFRCKWDVLDRIMRSHVYCYCSATENWFSSETGDW